MTKKHYIEIARVLKEQLENLKTKNPPTWDRRPKSVWVVSRIANALCDLFIEDNPRFDKSRFLTACGLEDPMSYN